MNAIIFLAPISCFDQVLMEDNTVNRLVCSFVFVCLLGHNRTNYESSYRCLIVIPRPLLRRIHTSANSSQPILHFSDVLLPRAFDWKSRIKLNRKTAFYYGKALYKISSWRRQIWCCSWTNVTYLKQNYRRVSASENMSSAMEIVQTTLNMLVNVSHI